MPHVAVTLSVKVLVTNDAGHFLVLQRSKQSKGNPGKWDFPGGKVDPGESLDTAILREVAEETGLRIAITRVAGAAQSAMPDRMVAYLILEGCLESGELRLSEEHEGYAWVTLDQMALLDAAPQFLPFIGSFVRDHGK